MYPLNIIVKSKMLSEVAVIGTLLQDKGTLLHGNGRFISRRGIYLGFEWIVLSSYLTPINTSVYKMFKRNIKQFESDGLLRRKLQHFSNQTLGFSAKLKNDLSRYMCWNAWCICGEASKFQDYKLFPSSFLNIV